MVKKFEVGKKYEHINGVIRDCVFSGDHLVILKDGCGYEHSFPLRDRRKKQMSKKINEYQTDLEAGVRTIDVGRGRTIKVSLEGGAFEKFSLVVVRPVKGKKGTLVFSADIHAESVSHAVRLLREQIDGSGLIVLQKADFELPIINPVIADRMREAYVKTYGQQPV